MQHKLLLLLMAVFMGIASVHAQTGNESIKHKVVIQLSSNDTLVWKGLMNNLKNLKAGWGDSIKIEVVAHGFGIEMLMKEKTTQQEKITAFRKMVFHLPVAKTR